MMMHEWVTQYATENGLSSDEATVVIEHLQADVATHSLQERWNDDITTYPAVLQFILLMTLRHCVIAWMDIHAPLHRARSMFTEARPAKGTP